MSSTTTQRRKNSRPPDDNLEVVYIGDDPDLAELYRLKLQLDGYWVTTCATIKDGLEHIRTRMPDLVFVDLGSDSRRRSEELERLRSDSGFQEVPLVLLSRDQMQASQPLALQLGDRDFLVRVDTLPGREFWPEYVAWNAAPTAH